MSDRKNRHSAPDPGEPPDSAEPRPSSVAKPDVVPHPTDPGAVPRTRAGAAWMGLAAAAILSVALIVFMVQNTRVVRISFLRMTTSTSLAITLLIAAVAGVVLALVIGSPRIVQLRRLANRNRQGQTPTASSKRSVATHV